MAVNLDGLKLLSDEVDRKLKDARTRGKTMLAHRKAYAALDDRLEMLSSRVKCEVMVPLTSRAFMCGHLVHTNEILVLLGDNYFIETSSSQARSICQRRLQKCDKILQDIEAEIGLISGWRGEAGRIRNEEQDQLVDIKEEFDPTKEEEWKSRHRESLRKEKTKQQQEDSREGGGGAAAQEQPNDEELWARLEELEVREALEKEWEQSDDQSEEEEEQEEEEDEEEEQEEEQEEEEEIGKERKRIIISDNKEVITIGGDRRRVSWAEPRCLEQAQAAEGPDQRIFFSHSPALEEGGDITYLAHPWPLTPGHVGRPTPVKSILKRTASDVAICAPVDKPDEDKNSFGRETENEEPWLNPVCDTVVEKTLNVVDSMVGVSGDSGDMATAAKAPPKLSKFKAMRAQNRP